MRSVAVLITRIKDAAVSHATSQWRGASRVRTCCSSLRLAHVVHNVFAEVFMGQFDQINAHQTKQMRLTMLYFAGLVLVAAVLIAGLTLSV